MQDKNSFSTHIYLNLHFVPSLFKYHFYLILTCLKFTMHYSFYMIKYRIRSTHGNEFNLNTTMFQSGCLGFLTCMWWGNQMWQNFNKRDKLGMYSEVRTQPLALVVLASPSIHCHYMKKNRSYCSHVNRRRLYNCRLPSHQNQTNKPHIPSF